MDPELLKQAEAALEGGDYTPEEIDAVIAENSQYPNLFALRSAVEAGEHAEEAELAHRVADRGAIANTAGMALHGLSFGMIDELISALGGDGASFRQAVEENREAAPGASLASEIAGGLTLPGGAAAQVVNRGGRTARAVASGALAGGASGATATGLFSLGEGEGTLSERLSSLSPRELAAGGFLGAVTGGGAGGAGSIIRRRRAGRGDRVADALQEGTGVDPDITAARGAQREVQESVQERLYGPLEREFASVDDPAINAFVGSLAENPSTRALVRRLGLAPQAGVTGPAKLPSFEDLQNLRSQLRGRSSRDAVAGDLAAELDNLMGDTFGQPLREADRAWRQTNQQLDNLELGWKKHDAASAEVAELTRRMSPEELAAFQQGQLSRIDSKLRARDRDAVGLLRKYLDAGSETHQQLRAFFPNDQSFDQFMGVLGAEQSADRIMGLWSTLARPVGLGAGAGAGFSFFN